MSSDQLLSPSYPEVLKVRYLADDVDSYMSGFAVPVRASAAVGAIFVEKHEHDDSTVAIIVTIVTIIILLKN